MYWSILRTRSRASKTCSVCLSMKASYISVFRKCGIALIACASQRLLSTCSKITMKALPGHDLRPMLNSRKFSQPTAWTKASSHEKLVQNCSISKKTAQELDRTDFSIHFHAWTMDGRRRKAHRNQIRAHRHLRLAPALALVVGIHDVALLADTHHPLPGQCQAVDQVLRRQRAFQGRRVEHVLEARGRGESGHPHRERRPYRRGGAAAHKDRPLPSCLHRLQPLIYRWLALFRFSGTCTPDAMNCAHSRRRYHPPRKSGEEQAARQPLVWRPYFFSSEVVAALLANSAGNGRWGADHSDG